MALTPVRRTRSLVGPLQIHAAANAPPGPITFSVLGYTKVGGKDVLFTAPHVRVVVVKKSFRPF